MPLILFRTLNAENRKEEQFQVRDISELVRQGQDIVVQVVKDPLGTKGARLTTDITACISLLEYLCREQVIVFPSVLKTEVRT